MADLEKFGGGGCCCVLTRRRKLHKNLCILKGIFLDFSFLLLFLFSDLSKNLHHIDTYIKVIAYVYSKVDRFLRKETEVTQSLRPGY